MSQQLQVLKCYSCETFQVHIVKKSTKWDCKICGEKQTVKKIYGQGSGADCRRHVQLLNELRMKNDSTRNYTVISEVDNGDDVVLNNLMSTCVNTKERIQQVKSSKWDKYLSTGSHEPNCGEEIESDWSIPKISSKVKVNDHHENYNNVNGQCSQEQLNFNLFDDFGEYDIFEHEMENEADSVLSAPESISSINKEAVPYHKSLLSNVFECDDELDESISSNNNEVVTYHKSLLSNVFCKHECDDGELDEILRL